MDIKEFTITLDEYVVVDPVDGFCYFWSSQNLKRIFFIKSIVRFALLCSMCNVSQC